MKRLRFAQGFVFGIAIFFPLTLSAIYVSNAIAESQRQAETVAIQTHKTN